MSQRFRFNTLFYSLRRGMPSPVEQWANGHCAAFGGPCCHYLASQVSLGWLVCSHWHGQAVFEVLNRHEFSGPPGIRESG